MATLYKRIRNIYRTCDCCETTISQGDEYYDMDGDIICEYCIDDWLENWKADHRYVADYEAEEADEYYERCLEEKYHEQ